MSHVPRDTIWEAVRISKKALIATGVFSLVLNVLMLSGSLYMLQVYDRVMTSRSIPTLIALSVMITLLFLLSGGLELIRSRILTRVGLAFDREAADRVFDASARLGLTKGRASSHHLREFDSLRQFLAGPGPAVFFDLPWAPIYLMMLFAFHWLLGTVSLVAALVLFSIAIATERITQGAVKEATNSARHANELAEAGHSNAEVLAAMGMLHNYRERWIGANRTALLIQSESSDVIGVLTSISKTLRMILQSGILGLGAYLAIMGEISMGSIIAGSILMGRALAPIEQSIAQWRNLVKARQSYKAISDLLKILPAQGEKIELPNPKGLLDVKGVRLAPPGTNRPTVNNVTFSIGPGQVLAVVGPSASGKSTLARGLVGVWPLGGGEVRLDGARLDQWDQQRLGSHIGYVPQDVELFAGTVRDNIARFDPNADDAAVIEAATLARAHKMILDLPQGYETELGSFGSHLSAGQKQRLALARALYGNPVLMVFDEPNSNLDTEGDSALLEAISELRDKKKTVVIVTHRSSAIAKADLLLVMEQGQQRAFGPREEVIRKLNAPATPLAQPAAQPAPAARAAAAAPMAANASQQRPQSQPTPTNAVVTHAATPAAARLQATAGQMRAAAANGPPPLPAPAGSAPAPALASSSAKS